MAQIDQGVRSIEPTKKQSRNVRISGGAIFGALSIVIGLFTAPILPRVPEWGMAFIDPISWIWIISFLIFGIEAGLITLLIGFMGLFLSDPTGIGPFFKLVSTIWFIVIPYLAMKFIKVPLSSEQMENRKFYSLTFLIAHVLRLISMITANLVVLTYVWHVPIQFLTFPFFGLDSISGVSAVISVVIIVNTIQSFTDALIPYLLVFRTPIKKFRVW